MIHHSNNTRGPGSESDEPRLPRSDFGKDAADFPRNAEWISPFQQTQRIEQLQLFGAFEITYPIPPGFQSIEIRLPQTRVALVAPDNDATLMIAAAELPPGQLLDRIAGQPFLNYFQAGARAPVVLTFPIYTCDGTRGHMINAPLMVPGALVGHPETPMVPMFKHTVVLGVGGYWFSFETQAWGVDLDMALEAQAQGQMYRQFKLAHRGVPLDFHLN